MATNMNITPYLQERGKPSTNWTAWKRSFENLLMYKDLDEASEKKKISFLLLNIGEYANEIFMNSTEMKAFYDAGKIPTLKEAMAFLDKRFLDIDTEWYCFHKLLTNKKEKGESLKDYLTHLKSLVKGCGIPHNFEDRLIAQLFILNIDDEEIQNELLTMNDKTLEQIETKAFILEKAKKEMHQMKEVQVKKVRQDFKYNRSLSRNRNSSRDVKQYGRRSPSRTRLFKCKKMWHSIL